MIVWMGGVFGAIAGLLIGGAWLGVCLVFGLPLPTGDQIEGLMMIGGPTGVVAGGILIFFLD